VLQVVQHHAAQFNAVSSGPWLLQRHAHTCRSPAIVGSGTGGLSIACMGTGMQIRAQNLQLLAVAHEDSR
jgi:hypothetical protein